MTQQGKQHDAVGAHLVDVELCECCLQYFVIVDEVILILGIEINLADKTTSPQSCTAGHVSSSRLRL